MKKVLIAVVATVAAFLTHAAKIDETSFVNRMEITVASGKLANGTELANFPLLVRLSSARQPGFDPSKCGTDGDGLRFALDDGTLLAHEIDTWNASGESLVWIRVPSLKPETKLYACWNLLPGRIAPAVTARDTWSGYNFVFHCGEASGPLVDSAKGLLATNPVAYAATAVATNDAKVGLARAIPATDATLVVAATNALNAGSALTLSGWFHVTTWESGMYTSYFQHKQAYNSGNGFQSNMQNSKTQLFVTGSGATSSTAINLPDITTDWLYLTYVYNGTTLSVYNRGAFLKSVTIISVADNTLPLKMCSSFIGSADELRFRVGAVDGTWVAADHTAQTDTAFLAYGEVCESLFTIAPIDWQALVPGSSVTPHPVVTLKADGTPLAEGEDKDYVLSWSDNNAVGVGTVRVEGRGTYAGQVAHTHFKIAVPFSDSFITSFDTSVVKHARHTGAAYAFTNVTDTFAFTLKDCKLVEVLVAGGGGAGGATYGGGGGAGGVVRVNPGISCDGAMTCHVSVGAGGKRGTSGKRGGAGCASKLVLGDATTVAYGGSGGGGNSEMTPLTEGGPFGSAGGAGSASDNNTRDYVGGFTESQGNRGGAGGPYGGGGGGGACGMGTTGSYNDAAGYGGNGLDCIITGVSHCYGSGGGGSGGNTAAHPGGRESGGSGLKATIPLSNPLYSGVNGLGGGGGGSRDGLGGNGGSGVVIVYVIPTGKKGFQASLDAPSAALAGTEARLKPTVKDVETGATLVEGTDYTLAWTDNTSVGSTAHVTVTGLGNYDTSSATLGFAVTKVHYVKPDGSNDTDGTNGWAAATTLTNALAQVANGDEIWAMEGDYVFAKPVSVSGKGFTLRGGFAGTETNEYDRVAGARSVIDGGKTNKVFEITNDAGLPVFIDGMAFVRSWEQGFKKSGAGDLTLKNCRFYDNGWRNLNANGNYESWKIYWMNGMGVGLNGSSAAKLVMTDCLFDGNRTRSDQYARVACNGVGAYINAFAEATMENCLFVTNGSATSGSDMSYGRNGAAMYVNDTPLQAKNCTFLGNRGYQDVDNGGGIMLLYGNCHGASFDHCAWIANSMRSTGDANNRRGTVLVSLGNVYRTVSFNHCTIAYNAARLAAGTPGLSVFGATAKIRNSILYGNLGYSGATSYGVDFHVASGAKADVAYTWFTSDTFDSFTTPGTFVRGDGLKFGDPLLATPQATTKGLLSTALAIGSTTRTDASELYYKATTDFLSTFDWHLESAEGRRNGSVWVKDQTTSEAVDAGDPAAPYLFEPTPNGGAANLGFYGNTSAASLTPTGLVEFGTVTVDQTADYSQPFLTVPLTGDSAYQATVVLCYGSVNGAEGTTNGWANVRTVATVRQSGDTLVFGIGEYFNRGDLVYWQVLATTAGGTTSVICESAIEVAQDRPLFDGKSGGAHVVHVWGPRLGNGTGTDWANACASLDAAISVWQNDETKTEIWIAGVVTNRTVASAGRALVIRGGFAGGETTLASRPAGLLSEINGEKLGTPLALSGAGAVTIERLRFREGYEHGFVKTGSGSLVVTDCDFRDNGWRSGDPWPGVQGYGIGGSFSGSSTTTLVLSNCVFQGNQTRNGEYLPRGAGAYFSTFARVTMDDCAFVTNGVSKLGAVAGSGCWSSSLLVNGAPLTARNCRFVGNASTAHGNNSETGGSMRMIGNCAGSAFTNCAWIGNTAYHAYTPTYAQNAALCIQFDSAARKVDFANCTFAYNVFCNQNGAAALQIACGTAHTVNSIFYGNVTINASTFGADVHVASGSTNVVEYCLFQAETNRSFTAAGRLAMSDIVYGDPLFMTSLASVTNLLSNKVTIAPLPRAASALHINNKELAAETLNIHLRSRAGYTDENTGALVTFSRIELPEISPAIDAGDQASPFANEPAPNGKRVNLGFYGNTPWASRSPTSGLVFRIR